MNPGHIAAQEHLVTRDHLEALLAGLRREVRDPRAGIFGPESVSWRINRESALFLGAGRAALLQLAHPWVAVAIEQHSQVMNKPIERFHNTFRIVFTTIFGSAEQALAAARSLHTLHTGIQGEIPSDVAGYERNSHYEANFVPALRWVFATLIESAVLAHDFVLSPLTTEEREAYYAEAKRLAALFGIPEEALPPDWNAFISYIDEMCSSNELGVDELSRKMGHNILDGAGSWIHPPRWYRALTAEWMPARFRDEFALPFGDSQRRSVERARRWLALSYRSLPHSLRFTGPYHEACARLAKKPAGPLTRINNRFWIGESQMPFAE
ncbi:MAG TPA: oxygenase MpaB family protein [Terracidiphilus sp.]|nr:oxygenase MpaB family protein [Terracidiphilus sp.]